MISSVILPAALLMSQAMSQGTSATVTANIYGNKDCTGPVVKTFDTPTDKCLAGTDLVDILDLEDTDAEDILSKFSAKASCSSALVPSFVVYQSTDCTGSALSGSSIGQSSNGTCTFFPQIQTGLVVNGTSLVCKVVNNTSTTLVSSATATATGSATASASATPTDVPVSSGVIANALLSVVFSGIAFVLL